MTTINYGYEAPQYRAYIRKTRSYVGNLYIWQVLSDNGAVKGGEEVTYAAARRACDIAVESDKLDAVS